MNGTATEEGSTIDRRPLITCAGELEVFSTIEDNLFQALPQDSCEWRRAQGRPVRSVHIGANFAPFSAASLPKGNQWDLIRRPLFHIYWTECTVVVQNHFRSFDLTRFCRTSTCTRHLFEMILKTG
jgi:hypothetical protein